MAFAIAQLFGLSAKLSPQVALNFIHVPVRIRLMDGKSFERLARPALGDFRACLMALSN
ncbi:MAG: hypothetical protein ACREXS_05550 [Gammaproteobacteria bacterium]